MEYRLIMNRFFQCLLWGVIFVCVSCSSPTSVAEKALQIVGKGTFAPSSYDRARGESHSLDYILIFHDYDKVFDNAMIDSKDAEDIRKFGTMGNQTKESYFWFSNALFERWELVTLEKYNVDLYCYSNYDNYSELTEEAGERIWNALKNVHPDYQEFGKYLTYLDSKEVPASHLRYKLDNKYFADIIVLKLPKKGYRVCAFWIDQ